jgi:hypothetical protein
MLGKPVSIALRKCVFIIAVAAGAALVATGSAEAQKRRVGNAAMGAAAGAVVGGPVGAVAGGVIGYTAGENIARGMGIKRKRHYRRSSEARRRRD